jgi:phospholipase/lecithinase/hemolysin
MKPNNSRSALLASKATAAIKKRLQGGLLAIALLAACSGAQAGYSNLYVFGDSLSDTGNNATVWDTVGFLGYIPPFPAGTPPGTLRTPVPTPSDTFIPTFPYASNVYSNGPVWASSFASALGLSAAPSLTGGTNYAYGGARVGPLGDPNPFTNFPANFPPSLTTQVATFLGVSGGNAPSSALYVVAGGGNDARDIITKAAADIASNVNPTAGILAGAQAYASYVDAMVNSLEGAGAKDIVVWNAPNAGLGPAITANGAGQLGTLVTFLMNQALSAALTDDIADSTDNVRIFDLFGFSTAVATNPGAFGLVNGTDACSAIANITACAANDYNYFFWDGIHPTAAAHRLIAGAMVAFVPEPGTIVLLALGLFGIVATRKRQTI